MLSGVRLVLAAVVLVALGACTDPASVQQQAVGTRDGLQVAGQLAGSRITVSDGAPEARFEDCDPGDGADLDLCVLARTIDGANLGLVIENVAAFAAGETLAIRTDRCTGADCDVVTDHAVVEARLDGRVFRASSGRLVVTAWGPQRYAAELVLRFADGGGLTGTFDVAPSGGTP